MRVLVTGAAGFLGSHIVTKLLENDADVICFDNRPGASVHPKQTWITADITHEALVELVASVAGDVDAVIHLAAMAAPRECDSNPSLAFDVNVNGTSQVLQLALRCGAKKVVFSSSAHVYNIPPRYLPTDESHPLHLGTTYTTTKILGEQLCQLYYNNHGLSYVALRLFNAYGPGQGLGYFIPDQIAKATTGKIDLQGSDITKDWVFVEDVADAFVSALDSNFCGPINIGTGVETDLGSIAFMISKAFKAELVTSPATVPTRMCADWSRAQRVLGWRPEITLEEGLERTIEAWKNGH